MMEKRETRKQNRCETPLAEYRIHNQGFSFTFILLLAEHKKLYEKIN
jgi:hypothetical protein